MNLSRTRHHRVHRLLPFPPSLRHPRIPNLSPNPFDLRSFRASNLLLLLMLSAMASILPKNENVQIREVWCDNLEAEFDLIREIVDDFPYVAMDTEFPGIVCRSLGNFKTSSDFNYATLKANVDMLKLIQLGLTFSDDEGNLPTCGTGRGCVWQFNFREFDVQQDVFASDSIELLRQSGIDFKKNNEKGIDAHRFGELLMSSGIVLNDSVHWVTFHSGYDFGYLLKVLTCQNLPETQVGFFNLINIYFPTVYDIKHLMKFCNSLHGGLNKLAELLDVERVGICHQAGSDSLLTSCAFRKLKEAFFNGSTEKYAGESLLGQLAIGWLIDLISREIFTTEDNNVLYFYPLPSKYTSVELEPNKPWECKACHSVLMGGCQGDGEALGL